ncbi:MAG: transporter, partial [Planctomycetota bacterium]
MTRRTAAALLVCTASTAFVSAQDADAGFDTDLDSSARLDLSLRKAQYHLFNPTPKELRRPLASDRPDLTENPITVDAGAFQIESSFFQYTYNDVGGVETDTFEVLPSNFKVGLTNDIDLQLVWTPYVNVQNRPGADDDGVSDLQIRLKVNIWGNDSDGPTAFGFLPFITLPTGSDGISADEVEGGFLLPFTADLSGIAWEGLGLGAQVGFEWVNAEGRSGNDGTDAVFSHTTVLGQSLTDSLSYYLEYAGSVTID